MTTESSFAKKSFKAVCDVITHVVEQYEIFPHSFSP